MKKPLNQDYKFKHLQILILLYKSAPQLFLILRSHLQTLTEKDRTNIHFSHHSKKCNSSTGNRYLEQDFRESDISTGIQLPLHRTYLKVH